MAVPVRIELGGGVMDGDVEAVELDECLMGDIARFEVAPCVDLRVPKPLVDGPTGLVDSLLADKTARLPRAPNVASTPPILPT
jgi:hypothetical protein